MANVPAATVLTVAVVLAPLAARADPPQPASVPPAPPANAGATPASTLAHYPAAARAAGVEGSAILACDRDAHLALKACKLVSETPAGQGFGQAALDLAALSPPNPKLDLADPARHPPITLTVRFTLHPPAITPDLSEMGHTLTQPRLATGPTRAQVQAAYPVRALSDGVDGAALIACRLDAKGVLHDCQVAGEQPAGYGFGAAALDLAADFKLTPRLVDGEPVGGAEVRFPVPFHAAPDPDAPLQLGAPAGQ